jgi:hypothetical protein
LVLVEVREQRERPDQAVLDLALQGLAVLLALQDLAVQGRPALQVLLVIQELLALLDLPVLAPLEQVDLPAQLEQADL